jgi:hypothetical protein
MKYTIISPTTITHLTKMIGLAIIIDVITVIYFEVRS